MEKKKKPSQLYTKSPELSFVSLLSDQVLLTVLPLSKPAAVWRRLSRSFNYFFFLRLGGLKLISQVFSLHDQAKMHSEDFSQKLCFSTVSFLLS